MYTDFNALRKRMDGYEKCSLVALFIAYIVIILLIITYEVTGCQMSRIKQILNIGNHSMYCYECYCTQNTYSYTNLHIT